MSVSNEFPCLYLHDLKQNLVKTQVHRMCYLENVCAFHKYEEVESPLNKTYLLSCQEYAKFVLRLSIFTTFVIFLLYMSLQGARGRVVG
jgi:hypothetical protein